MDDPGGRTLMQRPSEREWLLPTVVLLAMGAMLFVLDRQNQRGLDAERGARRGGRGGGAGGATRGFTGRGADGSADAGGGRRPDRRPIRADPAMREIPVVMLVSKELSADELDALQRSAGVAAEGGGGAPRSLAGMIAEAEAASA